MGLSIGTQNMLKAFHGRCVRCLRAYDCIHEIEPRSSGKGKVVPENQVPLCASCHNEIHTFGAANYISDLKELRQRRLKAYANYR